MVAAFSLVEGVGGINPTLPHRRNPTDTHWDHSASQKCTTGPRGDPRVQDAACSHGAQLAPRRERTHGPGPGTQTHGGRQERSPRGDGGAHSTGLNHRRAEEAGGGREQSGGRPRGAGGARLGVEAKAKASCPSKSRPPEPEPCRAPTPLTPRGPATPAATLCPSPCPEEAPHGRPLFRERP